MHKLVLFSVFDRCKLFWHHLFH